MPLLSTLAHVSIHYMIFAHAPLGYLTARSIKQWWNSHPAWLYFIGALGGIFPDIDLFYFYVFNATQNHRQFPTHSVLPYLILFCISLFLRKKCIGKIGLVFTVGAFSHLMADSLMGRLVWLYPFSLQLYGLSSIPGYANSIMFSYGLTTNYTAELIVFIITGYTVFKKKLWYVMVSGIIFVPAVFGLIWLDQHTYKTDSVFAYDDSDHDGLTNAQDDDIDGDGRINSFDQSGDVDAEWLKLINAYYDFTNGGFIQIPLRMGFVNDHILIERLYTNIGIPFAPELAVDYERSPSGYESTPKDYRFVSNVHNWQTWLKHTQRWLPAEALAQARPYDIIFFQSGHVALFYSENGQAKVIDVSPQQRFTAIVALQEVVAREGEIVCIGRLQ